MSLPEFNEFFSVTWYENPIQRLNKVHKVANSKIVLDEIPDEFQKVIISGKFEIKQQQNFPTVNPELYYKVNYLNGEVTFGGNLDGDNITITSYYGRGNISYYAKKLIIEDAWNNWNSTNMEDLSAEIKSQINNLYAITESLKGYGN